MTQVSIYRTSQGEYRGFAAKGHTGYGCSGSDILCAAVSALVINTVNSLEELAGLAPEVVTDEGSGLIGCRWASMDPADKRREKAELLMEALILGLTGIRRQYGKTYIDLTFEEV